MTKKFQIIICVFVIMGVMLGIPSIQVDATSNHYTSIEQIYRNINQYDGQDVTLTGKVVGLTFSESDSGNKYTTFMLDDDTAAPLKVFSYSHLLISEGDTVKVSGTFHEALEKGDYTFYMQIVATPGEVEVIVVENLLSKLLPVIIAIFVIVAIFLAYKRYKKDLTPDNHKRGKDFEKVVIDLFNKTEWNIEDWTRDVSGDAGRLVRSDMNPDVIVSHKETGRQFAIECKYRSKFGKGKFEEKKGFGVGIEWANKSQIKNYKRFEEKKRIPVYILIGFGGSPNRPERMFLAQLKAVMSYESILKRYLEDFERSPKDKFTIEEFKK